MAKGHEGGVGGTVIGKAGSCQNLTPNVCPVSTTDPISLCLPGWQKAPLNQQP